MLLVVHSSCQHASRHLCRSFYYAATTTTTTTTTSTILTTTTTTNSTHTTTILLAIRALVQVEIVLVVTIRTCRIQQALYVTGCWLDWQSLMRGVTRGVTGGAGGSSCGSVVSRTVFKFPKVQSLVQCVLVGKSGARVV